MKTTDEVMRLDPEVVNAVFVDCLFKSGEDTTQHVRADGITKNVGFHPQRLAAHADAITAMLRELPETFHKASGGGWSFLNACQDRHGEQWTGLHQRMEQLFLLGIGIGKVKLLMPREMWSALPGGMPYYVIDCDEKAEGR